MFSTHAGRRKGIDVALTRADGRDALGRWGHSDSRFATSLLNVVDQCNGIFEIRSPRRGRYRFHAISIMPRHLRTVTWTRAETPVDRLALAIATHGFGSRWPLPSGPVPDDVFANLLSLAELDRLLGAMAELVSKRLFPVTEDQRRSLTNVHSGWLHHDLIVERLLQRVGDCFDRRGIEFRVLKGTAIAHILYPDPSWRVFGDLDLLIRSDQFDAAVRLAREEMGGVQPVPELRPGFDHEFGKEALIRVGDIELDLHRTFVTGPFGLTIDPHRLFQGETSFEVGGRRFAALEPSALFLHLCYNVALGDHPVRLCSLRDLSIAHERLEFDISTIPAIARDWRAIAVVQRAAQLAVDAFDLDPAHDLSALSRLAVPRSEAWLLRSYLTSARSYSRPLASLAVIPGVRARFRYTRALLLPSAEYLRSRGWSERSHLRRAADRLIRRE